MATTSKTHERHFLFHRELSDAPGRDGSWDEYLRYRDDSRWEQIVEGTDFSGTRVANPEKEAMSTTALVNWVVERDAETTQGSTDDVDDPEESDADDLKRQFGPRAERLRDIAENVGATYCLSCLDGWRAGPWPASRQRAVRILGFKGAMRRRGVDQDLSKRLRRRYEPWSCVPISAWRGSDCEARSEVRESHVAGSNC